MFTQYIREGNSTSPPDTLEQLGDFLLKPLRLFCGRFVTVGTDQQYIANKIERIVACAFLLLFCPLTIPLSIIGSICVLRSGSYQRERSKEEPIPFPKESIEEPDLSDTSKNTKEELTLDVSTSQSVEESPPSTEEPELSCTSENAKEELTLDVSTFQSVEESIPFPKESIEEPDLSDSSKNTKEELSLEATSSESEKESPPSTEEPELSCTSKNTKEELTLDVSTSQSVEESIPSPKESIEEPDLSDTLEKSNPTWKRIYIFVGAALLGIPLIYFAQSEKYPEFIHQQALNSFNEASKVYAKIFTKSNFDSIHPPLTAKIALPLVRCFCYESALFLGARKTVQGVASIGSEIFFGKQPSETRKKSSFEDHLFRDILLTLGLFSTGLWIEGVESNLNLYLQRIEIDKKPLTQIFNGNYDSINTWFKSFYQKETPAPIPQIEEIPPSVFTDFFNTTFFQEKIKPMADTAIHSMKRIRITPLKTHSDLELHYGVPLSRLGFTNSEPVQLFSQYDFKQLAHNFTDCLSNQECLLEKKDQLREGVSLIYRSTERFLKDPVQSIQTYSIKCLSDVVEKTYLHRIYTEVLSRIRLLGES